MAAFHLIIYGRFWVITEESIAEKIGPGPSAIKRAGGWLLEKLARFKLGHTGSSNFEMFESLELLAVGIHGKQCLWRALKVTSRLDSRLREYDFEALDRRAQQQYDKVESKRLDLAQTVLSFKLSTALRHSHRATT